MSKKVQINLLYSGECQNILAIGQILLGVIETTDVVGIGYSEIDIKSHDCPPHLTFWPVPSVLINGIEIKGILPNPDPVKSLRTFSGKKLLPEEKVIAFAMQKALNETVLH